MLSRKDCIAQLKDLDIVRDLKWAILHHLGHDTLEEFEQYLRDHYCARTFELDNQGFWWSQKEDGFECKTIRETLGKAQGQEPVLRFEDLCVGDHFAKGVYCEKLTKIADVEDAKGNWSNAIYDGQLRYVPPKTRVRRAR